MRARACAFVAVGLGLVAAAGCRGILGAEKAELEQPSQDGGAGQGGSSGQAGAAGQAGDTGQGGSAGDDGGLDGPVALGPLECFTVGDYEIMSLDDASLQPNFDRLHMVRLNKNSAAIAATFHESNGASRILLARVGPGGIEASSVLPGLREVIGLVQHKQDRAAVLTLARSAASSEIRMVELPANFSTNDIQAASDGVLFVEPSDAGFSGSILFTSSGNGDIVMTRKDGTDVAIAVYAPNVNINPTLPVPIRQLSTGTGYDEAKAAIVGDWVVAMMRSTNVARVITSQYGNLDSAQPKELGNAMIDVFPYADNSAGVMVFPLGGSFPEVYFGTMTQSELAAFDWQKLKVPMDQIGPTFMSFVGDRHALFGRNSWISFGFAGDQKQIGYTWLDNTGELRAQAFLAGFKLTSSKIAGNELAIGDEDFHSLGGTLHYGWIEKPDPDGPQTLHHKYVKCQPALDAGR